MWYQIRATGSPSTITPCQDILTQLLNPRAWVCVSFRGEPGARATCGRVSLGILLPGRLQSGSSAFLSDRLHGGAAGGSTGAQAHTSAPGGPHASFASPGR